MPSAPVIMLVTAIDSYSVHITWRMLFEANGVITHYTISYNIDFREDSNFTIDVPFTGETVSTSYNNYSTICSYLCICIYVCNLRFSHTISLDCLRIN